MALYDIPVHTLQGEDSSLGEYAGKTLLVVNVASKCGLTPQYEGLERLQEREQGRGFTVLAFPANNFGGQEPGTDAEIAEFCSTNYAVTFPLMSKISVVGDDKHPLYQALTAAVPTADGKADFRENLRSHGITPTEDPDVLWNFEKFLIGREGEVAARFAPAVAPDDLTLVAAIEAQLSR